MTKHHLLLVDGDPGALRLMEASLVKSGFVVTTAADGRDALARCRVVRPDLVLSETAMPGMDGFELRRSLAAHERLADVPFVFLTAHNRSVEDKVRGLELADDYLTKPIAVREVVARVRILLEKKERERLDRRAQRANLTGALSDMSVADLIQTLEIGSKTGTVHVEDADGRTATIWMRSGRVLDCVAGPLSGEAAFYRLLRWKQGRFALELKPVDRPERIRLPTQLLLIDGTRRIDEWGRTLEQLPVLDTVLQIDFLLLYERLAEIPDEVNAILKLIDGRRTLAMVIEESVHDDLTTASAIAMLLREGILSTRAMLEGEPRAIGAIPAKTPAQPRPPPEPVVEEAAGVDWFAGPTGAEPPPGSAPPPAPQPASPAQSPDGAPPRIVRFAARPKSLERRITPADPAQLAATAPHRRRHAYTVTAALIGAVLLALGAWAIFSGKARAVPRPAAHVDTVQMRLPLESNR